MICLPTIYSILPYITQFLGKSTCSPPLLECLGSESSRMAYPMVALKRSLWGLGKFGNGGLPPWDSNKSTTILLFGCLGDLYGFVGDEHIPMQVDYGIICLPRTPIYFWDSKVGFSRFKTIVLLRLFNQQIQGLDTYFYSRLDLQTYNSRESKSTPPTSRIHKEGTMV